VKIDKAIEILEQWNKRTNGLTDKDFHDAEKLGVEALKFRRSLEQENPDITLEPLPGETEQ